MTPLAQHIVKQMFVPEARREFKDAAGVLPKMADAHFFECSAVKEMAEDLGRDALGRGASVAASAFLPAPVTWLEFAEAGVGRFAILLEGPRCAERFMMTAVGHRGSGHLGFLTGFDSALSAEAVALPLNSEDPRRWCAFMYGLLAIINTPRVIGRKQHMPHRGLERRLLKARPTAGMFPLRGWTELKLEAFAQQRDESGKVHEAHLTGERCRHFCRAHLRIRLGKLEVVSAHWRGDAALGIKQTRYLVAPPRAGAAA
jgi:hypothetical protein